MDLAKAMEGIRDPGAGADGPGLGSTTELVLAANPAGYVGVDRDEVSAARVVLLAGGLNRSVVNASVADTGLWWRFADMVSISVLRGERCDVTGRDVRADRDR